MNLNSKDILFDHPILSVREVIRLAMYERLNGNSKREIYTKIANILHASQAAAARLLNQLIDHGYLSLTKEKQFAYNSLVVEATEVGRILGIAKANPPISREKAEHLLAELIERARSINRNQEFTYYVANLSVFGSYLSTKEELGDLDVFYQILRRYAGQDYVLRSDQRIQIARNHGRQFSSIIDEYTWPFYEVLRLLKTRKKGLSLHDQDSDDVFKRTTCKAVYSFSPNESV